MGFIGIPDILSVAIIPTETVKNLKYHKQVDFLVTNTKCDRSKISKLRKIKHQNSYLHFQS